MALLSLVHRHNTEIHERIVHLLEIARRRPGFAAHTRDGLRIEPAELGRLIHAEIAPRLHGQRAALLSGCVVEKRIGLRAKHFL